jgi:hypothetical protein
MQQCVDKEITEWLKSIDCTEEFFYNILNINNIIFHTLPTFGYGWRPHPNNIKDYIIFEPSKIPIDSNLENVYYMNFYIENISLEDLLIMINKFKNLKAFI